MGSPTHWVSYVAAMLTPILARVKILTKTFDRQHLAMLSPKIGNVGLAMENGFVPNLVLACTCSASDELGFFIKKSIKN